MNLLTSLQQPVIFAHRGSCAYAPENTLASFQLALQHQADAVELDAKLSADGQVVVIHDQTVDRTTNGSGKVNQLPLAALKELDAGAFFGPQFAGEKIPTLAEVFESIGAKLYINIELTNYASPLDGLVDRVCALVQRYGLEDRVMFSSFNPFNLLRAGRLLPGVPRGMLTFEGASGAFLRGLPGRWAGPQALHPYLDDVTPELVASEHSRGRRVHVWTVNQEPDLRRMLACGVDGLFTDDPPLARKLLGRQ